MKFCFDLNVFKVGQVLRQLENTTGLKQGVNELSTYTVLAVGVP